MEQTAAATAVARLERCCTDAQLACLKLLKELNDAKRIQAQADLDRNEELIVEYTKKLEENSGAVHQQREEHGKNVVSVDIGSDDVEWDQAIEASSVADFLLQSDEPSESEGCAESEED